MTSKSNSNRAENRSTLAKRDYPSADKLMAIPAREWWHVKSVFDQLVKCAFSNSKRNVDKLKQLTKEAYDYYEGAGK